MAKATKNIGVLFGMEDTFPWALMNAVTALSGGEFRGCPVDVSYLRDGQTFDYAAILDRISHDVKFYRVYLKCAAARGTVVINNPFWCTADDKFFNNLVAESVGVAVPKTVLLPPKERPPATKAESFRNMHFVEWDDVFAYLGFPIFMKPADGGGWRDVYKCDSPEAFFAAYDGSRDLCMMAQEAIAFTQYYRLYVLGRSNVLVMPYDPGAPHHERYVRDAPAIDPQLDARMRREGIALCDALGYDMNTVEFAVRDGVPYAIDFMNPAPDADRQSVGDENFDWVVNTMANVLIDRVRRPRPFETTGCWPQTLAAARPAVAAR
ncbi:MAG: hypothetical protein WB615_14320 [Candidatus Tumulicola sp.]